MGYPPFHFSLLCGSPSRGYVATSHAHVTARMGATLCLGEVQRRKPLRCGQRAPTGRGLGIKNFQVSGEFLNHLTEVCEIKTTHAYIFLWLPGWGHEKTLQLVENPKRSECWGTLSSMYPDIVRGNKTCPWTLRKSPEVGTKPELAASPLPSWGPKRGRKCHVTLAFSGVPRSGDKIRIGCLTPAFSGAQKRAEMLPNPCVLRGPQKRGQN